MHARLLFVGLIVAAISVGACGSADDEPQAQPTRSPLETESPARSSPSPTDRSPSPEPDAIEVEVEEGRVEAESDTVTVALGEKVRIEVEADTTDEVHVHGYDRFAEVSPGNPARISFTADIPGQFEVELEDAGLLLFELVVE